MNHQQVYISIISKAKNRIMWIPYFEKHHIIPQSMGGSDEPENIVLLTAREHFICHLLLSKIYGGSMIYAAWMMSNMSKYTSKDYAWLKEKCSKLRKGKTYFEIYGKENINPRKGKTYEEIYGDNRALEIKNKVSEGQKGITRSKDFKRNLSEKNKGRIVSEKYREILSQSCKNGRFGIKKGPLSDETKQKISQATKGKIISIELRKRMSEYRTGRPVNYNRSEESKEKRSKGMLGKNKGKKHTDEAKEKIGKAAIGRNIGRKRGTPHNKGKKRIFNEQTEKFEYV